MSKQTANTSQNLTRLIEDIVDKGASTAEEINRAVLDLPVTMLGSLGLEDTASELKEIQDSSIGAVYNLIHEINHKVADIATEILEQQDASSR